jgi:hypothetical protein
MELIKLKRSVHGKSAWGVYSFEGGTMDVYLQNNQSGKSEWGELSIVCHIKPKGKRVDFSNYSDFRKFRATL